MLALAWTAVIGFGFYAVLATVLYVAQRSLMYFPDTAHVVPADAGLPEADVEQILHVNAPRLFGLGAQPVVNRR